MEAKPIFIIKLTHQDGESMRDSFSSFVESMKESMSDYHVLVVITEGTSVQFEAFYPKDFDAIELEKMQQMVLDSLPKPDSKNANTPSDTALLSEASLSEDWLSKEDDVYDDLYKKLKL